jgi:hypothetical protein
MLKALIQSVYARCRDLTRLIVQQQNGQALPIALAVLALGTLVIGPFLSHASTTLKSSGQYKQSINETYACEAGVEQVFWALTNDNLDKKMTKAGDSLSYTLAEKINNLGVDVTVTFLGPSKSGSANAYHVLARAGGSSISSNIDQEKGVLKVTSWDVQP